LKAGGSKPLAFWFVVGNGPPLSVNPRTGFLAAASSPLWTWLFLWHFTWWPDLEESIFDRAQNNWRDETW
jgi:hypothetical protein